MPWKKTTGPIPLLDTLSIADQMSCAMACSGIDGGAG
jgi:hypothetical protein